MELTVSELHAINARRSQEDGLRLIAVLEEDGLIVVVDDPVGEDVTAEGVIGEIVPVLDPNSVEAFNASAGNTGAPVDPETGEVDLGGTDASPAES